MLCIDKPFGWTSFDVVKKVRGMLSERKVGHAGTLDPLASGLLLLCMGRETKEIGYYQSLPKTYQAVITLGSTTSSHDSETPRERTVSVAHLSPEQIRKKLQTFERTQEQLPPAFSAIKVKGKRAYHLARANRTVPLQPREVTIHKVFLHAIALPYVCCVIKCSKGTYIRSFARDLGTSLGVGGYLSFLRRTEIGHFSLRDAHTPRRLEELLQIRQIRHVHSTQ